MKEDIPVRVDEDISKQHKRWILRGDKGVIEFSIRGQDHNFYPHDLCIHAKARQGDTSVCFNCHLIGGICYFSNLSEMRNEVFAVWKKRSSEGVWRYLEKLYDDLI